MAPKGIGGTLEKLDEKTVVPLGWVLGGFVSILSVTVIGAFWVSAVNYRLQRIEEKLGIPQFKDASLSLSFDAHAAPRKK